LLLAVFAAAVALVSASEVEVKLEEGVYVLTDDTFFNFVEAHEFVLTEFYAPWCGHCKALAPEYSKAAQSLASSGSLIKLAKVDATEQTEIAEKFEVRLFPTLMFFRNGNPSKYNGGRTSDEIVSWVTKKSGPVAQILTTVDELSSLQNENEVVIVGYFSDPESEAAKAFLEAAVAFDDDEVFAMTYSDDVRRAAGLEGDIDIVLLKKFDDKRADFKGSFTVADIEKFVAKNNIPLVMEFGPDTQKKIFGGPVNQHLLLFVDKTAPGFEDLMKCYTEAAKQFLGKVMHIIVDTNLEVNVNALNFFSIATGTDRALRLINLQGDMTKYAPTGDVECSMFVLFVEDYLAGKLHPYLNSEDVPSNWDTEPVKVLVGKNFKEVALAEDKHVFVEFYAPWCGHCKALASTWERLAKTFEDEPSIVIASMDSTANEVEEVKISGFPTLKFFPKGNSEPVDYTGERDFDSLKKFVEEHAGLKVDSDSDNDEKDKKDSHEEL